MYEYLKALKNPLKLKPQQTKELIFLSCYTFLWSAHQLLEGETHRVCNCMLLGKQLFDRRGNFYSLSVTSYLFYGRVFKLKAYLQQILSGLQAVAITPIMWVGGNFAVDFVWNGLRALPRSYNCAFKVLKKKKCSHYGFWLKSCLDLNSF